MRYAFAFLTKRNKIMQNELRTFMSYGHMLHEKTFFNPHELTEMCSTSFTKF